MKNLFKMMLPKNRILEQAKSLAIQVDARKEYYRNLSDEELKAKTDEFIKILNSDGGGLDLILVDAMATVREAAYRETGMFAYFVQIIGAIVVTLNNFAEMKTGEGKTLTLVLASYVCALFKKGLHLVTVNQYLVERDAIFANKILNRLNMTARYNSADFKQPQKKEAFLADVTYTTNSELGFDYLRDNMVSSYDQKVLRGLNFAIVDEADSVLIDEARTPLIISGQPQQDSEIYLKIDDFVKTLNENDYEVDPESQSVSLTLDGMEKANKFFSVKNIYDFVNSDLLHKVSNAIMANYIFENGKEYIVSDGEIKLVDHFTGRIMEGRSYSNGLQQAIQAKEKVKIEPENITVASITYQSLFRNYENLSAVSGTAITEKEEFLKIYNMVVVPIPTNKPIIRKDFPDYVFDTKESKYEYLIQEIKERHELGQPILVGTANVVDSEIISNKLSELNIKHEVLNAKNNKKEADIIALAGQKGAITIATNMAGRGTDIKLGLGVKELGGLYVIGTEKNEARRIDQQLRGRSGRQGDPGESRFFISLEDSIFQRYATDRTEKAEKKYDQSDKKDKLYDSKFFNWIISNTQKKVEGINFDMRKYLIDYDQVLSNQRELIYKQRDQILLSDNNLEIIKRMCSIIAKDTTNIFWDKTNTNKINISGLTKALNEQCFHEQVFNVADFKQLNANEITEKIHNKLLEFINKKVNEIGLNMCNIIAKQLLIQNLDDAWTKYLDLSNKLREGVSLRSLEQVSPLHLYVEESDKAFEKLKKDVAYQTVFAFISQTSNSSNINNLNIDSIKKSVEEYQQTQNLIQNKQDTTNKPDAKDILAMMMLQQQNKQEKEKENIKNDQQK
ncbi:MAG: preprotein translocase subunit SecA [Mycoplasmataceae bacterium]|nr:preprotein translocase subunit SecA [Mycoplasmataceae bacterium]